MAGTETSWAKDAGIGKMDLPEWVPVRRDALQKFAEDLAGLPSIRDMIRGMHEHWEPMVRAYHAGAGDGVPLGREQQIELIGGLLALGQDSVNLYTPLYLLRKKLAGEARLARRASAHGWPSGEPHPEQVRFWVRTGRGIAAVVHERLSREQLSHVAGLLDDALRWADRLEVLVQELELVLRRPREAANITIPLLLERHQRIQHLADAVWVRLPPIKRIIDDLSGNSSRDRSPPPPATAPLLVAKPIRRSMSI